MIGGGLSYYKSSERCSGRLARDKLKLYAIFRFSAQFMSNRCTTTRVPESIRRRSNWPTMWGILLCVAAGLMMAGSFAYFFGPTEIERGSPPARLPIGVNAPTTAPVDAAASTAELNEQRIELIDDDGRTLWVSPTTGPPLDLSYLPPGCQIMVALRWRDLLRHDEGIKLVNAPVMQALDVLRDDLELERVPLDLPRMLIGLQIDNDGNWLMSRVAYFDIPLSEANKTYLRELYSSEEYKGKRYGINDDLAYYFPSVTDADRRVVVPKSLIAEIIDLNGDPPPLRRDMERLLAHTDADRIVTILFSPNSLFGEGGGTFAGEMARLRESLFWFLGDELSAAALSMHWDDNFFVELVATPTLDTSPERAARILAERLAQVPGKVEQYIAGLKPRPYSREILTRFPAMLRTMVAYTRSGVENGNVVLRCYLPAVAGHNLLTGTELTLAESAPASRTVAEATAPSADASTKMKSLGDKLRRVTSFRFGRDTLEAALDQLARDIGASIIIRGADLQAEGITKNQSFGIDLENKPAEEILVAILRLANPDKTASGPDDTRQKLVYVISSTGPQRGEQIVVTTRAAATERGDALPPVFTQKRP